MLPVRLLPLRNRPVRFVRLPSSAGMLPVRLLPSRLRVVRFVRLPSSAGMLPLMPGPEVTLGKSSLGRPCAVFRLSAVTLLDSTVTPVQAFIF